MRLDLELDVTERSPVMLLWRGQRFSQAHRHRSTCADVDSVLQTGVEYCCELCSSSLAKCYFLLILFYPGGLSPHHLTTSHHKPPQATTNHYKPLQTIHHPTHTFPTHLPTHSSLPLLIPTLPP